MSDVLDAAYNLVSELLDNFRFEIIKEGDKTSVRITFREIMNREQVDEITRVMEKCNLYPAFGLRIQEFRYVVYNYVKPKASEKDYTTLDDKKTRAPEAYQNNPPNRRSKKKDS